MYFYNDKASLMNNTFNAKRFGLLLKKVLLERPMQMFGFTGLILVLVWMIYFIAKVEIGFGPAQNLSYIWGLAGGGCFLASFVFGYFGSNASGASYLTLPASHLEKWLSGILIAGIFYPLIFLLFYRAMDAAFVAIYHRGLDPQNPLYRRQYDAVYLLRFDSRLASKVYPLFLMFTGVALLGSLYFNKASFIKTALVFCVVCLGIFGLNWLIAESLIGSIDFASPFGGVNILIGKEVGSVELPQKMFQTCMYTFDYVLPMIFWALTYVRLREKEF
jgi:hypothetical protein